MWLLSDCPVRIHLPWWQRFCLAYYNFPSREMWSGVGGGGNTGFSFEFVYLKFLFCVSLNQGTGFPGGSVVKNLPANVGDSSSTPGLGRCPGEGNGNSFQYSCLRNPMDWAAWGGHSPWGHKEDLVTKKTTNQGTPINWHDHVFSGGKFLRENLCYVTDSASQHHTVCPLDQQS